MAVGARALQERVVERAPGQRAPPQCEDHGAETRRCRRLGGGGTGAEDAADHEKKQRGDAQTHRRASRALAPAGACPRRARGWETPGHVPDGDTQQDWR